MSVQTRDAAAEIDIEEGRPVRSLDELPSDRTARPVDHNAVTMLGGLTAAPVPIAPDIAPDIAPELSPDVPPELAAALAPVALGHTTAPADDAVPLGTTPSTRSGPNRVSFGTMIGHEMHAVQARVAAAIAEADSSVRGTAHGRDVHLPASPGMAVNPEPVAQALPIASAVEATAAISGTSPGSAAVAPSIVREGVREGFREGTREAAATGSHEALNEFSGGDHSFFETAPVNDEYEPENPRGRLYTRLAISGAVLAMVSVVVVAWVNSHGSSEEPPPVEIKTAKAPAPKPAMPAVPPPAPAVIPAAPAPVAAAPVRKEPAPTSTIPSSMPEAIPPPVAAAPAPVRIANAAPAGGASQPRSPSIAPPPAARDERKPVTASSSSAPAAPTPARQQDQKDQKVQKPAVAATPPAPAKPAAEPPAAKKPAAIAAKPAEAAHPAAPPHPREAARPASPAPKVALSPAARAPRPEATGRPVAKPSGPSAPRAQKGPPARGKGKYDPDGTMPLSFD